MVKSANIPGIGYVTVTLDETKNASGKVMVRLLKDARQNGAPITNEQQLARIREHFDAM